MQLWKKFKVRTHPSQSNIFWSVNNFNNFEIAHLSLEMKEYVFISSLAQKYALRKRCM